MGLTKLEQVLLGALLVSIALAFSTNLEVQFTLPKVFWLQGLAGLLILAWLARLRRGEVRTVPVAIAVPAFGLLAWWCVTTATAIDPSTAVFGAHGRYNGLINEATLVAIFLVVVSSASSTRDATWIAGLVVAALAPVAAFAIFQYVGLDPRSWPNPRPGSTIGHPVPLAALLSMVVPFVLTYVLTAADVVKRRLGVLVLLLFLVAVGTTLSRGPWVGLAVSIAIVLASAMRAGVFRVNPVATVLIFVVIVYAVWGGSSRPMVLLRARISGLARVVDDPSFMNRFVYFNAGRRVLGDHPVAGIGFENFGLVYPQYRPPEGDVVPVDQLPTKVHNGYLDRAVAHGVPGLILYLSLIGAVLLLLWRSTRGLMAASFAGAIAGFVVQDISGWEEISLSVFFWVLLGGAVVFALAEPPAPRQRWRPEFFGQVMAGLAGVSAVVALLTLSWFTLRQMRADQFLFESSALSVSDDWPRIEVNIGNAMRLAGDSAHDVDTAGVLYLRRFSASGERGAYERSGELLGRAIQANRFDPYQLIHRVDLETLALQRKAVAGPSPDAVTAAKRVVDMDPNNSTVHESVARYEFTQGHNTEALESIQRALSLRPRAAAYHTLAGDIYRSLGARQDQVSEYRLAMALVPPEHPEWAPAARRVVLALIESGDSRAALAEAEAIVPRAPKDAVLQTLAGIAFLNLKVPDQAIAAFREALALDPAVAGARQGLAEAEQLQATLAAKARPQ